MLIILEGTAVAVLSGKGTGGIETGIRSAAQRRSGGWIPGRGDGRVFLQPLPSSACVTKDGVAPLGLGWVKRSSHSCISCATTAMAMLDGSLP